MIIMTTVLAPPVTFTASAIEEVKRIQATDPNTAGKVLRVGVTGGGCSGMSYVLDFDHPTANDEAFEIQGVSMVMDKRHAIYLLTMEIDFQYGLNARGFVFRNPNATSTCGCGTSFSA